MQSCLAFRRVASSVARTGTNGWLRSQRAAHVVGVSPAAWSQRGLKTSTVTAPWSSISSTRSFATNAMTCFQCEQTEDTKACTVVGVCGKTPQVAKLQDILIHQLKAIGVFAHAARQIDAKYADDAVDRFVLQGMFATVTNVNFDPNRFTTYIAQAESMKSKAKALYEKACADTGAVVDSFADRAIHFDYTQMDMAALEAEADGVGIEAMKEALGEDRLAVHQMAQYGLKGAGAYMEHALVLGEFESQELAGGFQMILSELTNMNATLDELLGLCLKVGTLNLNVMAALDAGATGQYGHPEPTEATRMPKEGKCILVSGHDLKDLEHILKATEGTGVQVYTHGEMLPALAYPALKAYSHLAGHYGGPWTLQKLEFSQFPGPIVMTTNCIVTPAKRYQDRMYTRTVTGYPDVKHLETDDFSMVVQQALNDCAGFTADDVANFPKLAPYQIGFAHNTIMSVADTVVGAVKEGKIKNFFVIGGCDGNESERSYFTDIANGVPDDSVIMTLGCGKYRLNDKDYGNIGGVPRLLDLGQCNDAYSGIQVAVALAGALNTDVNSLPLHFAVSWFEQKAVAVLLSLLSLDIKNIHLGPRLPGFVTPAVLDVLVEKYQLTPTAPGEAESHLAHMLGTN